MSALRRSSAIESILDVAATRLASAGIATARLDARLLLAHAVGCDPDRVPLLTDRELGSAVAAFDALIERRLRREPVSRIRGYREFWSLEFGLGPDTLDPRPDSECVVEVALSLIPDRRSPRRLLDLGTGTGCLLLALLSELPGAWGLGVDLSIGALEMAHANAARLGLAGRCAFACTDWMRGIVGVFDLVVANPPYIAADDIARLEPDVRDYDPHRALSGGPDGLGAYRAIAPDLARVMAPGGHAVVEFGAGQAEAVGRVMREAGLKIDGYRDDLAGRNRCVVLGR